MLNNDSQKVQPLPGKLKRSFESAVRDIYASGATGRVSPYRSPIVRRAAKPASVLNEEKRAVSDAAKALAVLWKIAPKTSR